MAPSPANPAPEFSFRTRQIHWDRLKQNPDESVEIAIIGGGIVGAGLLRELSLRGAKNVFLFEKNDFASGTSGASSKLIHAGIRYLEQSWVLLKKGRLLQAWENFIFVVEASRERKILGRVAPGLVRPKQIYFVLSKSDPRSNLSLMAGVWCYYLIQLLQRQFFPTPISVFEKGAIEKKCPGLDAEKIKSVFSFWDSETDDARLVLANLQSANTLGGAALNYVELLNYEQTSKGIRLTLKDRETGEVVKCLAKRLVNASGAFLDEVRSREKNAPQEENKWIDRVAGSHIDIYPAIADRSYYISAPDNRLVFALRRDEDGFVYTRVGTTERSLSNDEPSDNPLPTPSEISYLENLVREFFPTAVLNEKTILKTDAGIRPLRSQAGLNAFDKSREHDIIEENGVLHIAGVKLTDFRRVATEVADYLEFPDKGDSTKEPLVSGDKSKIYQDTTVSEVVDKTMALHWDDYLNRRLGARPVLISRINPTLMRDVFDEFADLLGWDAARREQEWKILT